MNEKLVTYWDYIPDFRTLWKSNNNYGEHLSIEGLYASITPLTRKRKGQTVITYFAIVQGFNLPQVQNDNLHSSRDAEDWCESWLRHFYKRVMLEKQVACYKGWLDHYRDEFYKLKAKVNAQEWKEAWERIKAANPLPLDGSEVEE